MRTNLKLLRIKHKLTQAQMAQALGYSRMHYARIENGEQEVPMKLVVKLQERFNLSNAEVMELVKKDEE